MYYLGQKVITRHPRTVVMRCTWYYRYPLQVIAVARTANLIFIVLDVLKPLGHKKILEKELEGFGIRYAIFSFSVLFNLQPLICLIAVCLLKMILFSTHTYPLKKMGEIFFICIYFYIINTRKVQFESPNLLTRQNLNIPAPPDQYRKFL